MNADEMNVVIPEGSAFSTKLGYGLARILADELIQKEPIENLDECIDEFREMICDSADEKLNACISAIIRGEDVHNATTKIRTQRYYVSIQSDNEIEKALCAEGLYLQK